MILHQESGRYLTSTSTTSLTTQAGPSTLTSLRLPPSSCINPNGSLSRGVDGNGPRIYWSSRPEPSLVAYAESAAQIMVTIVASFVWSTTLVWRCALSGADLETSRSSASSARPVLICWASTLAYLCAGYQVSSTQQTAQAALGWGQVVISRMSFPSP